ncbi:MAG: hypothetical protein ACR2ND_15415 [Solirubrobacteraceae bacterium]
MLTDDQIIDELRRALAAETDGIDPRPGLLGRVHHELAAIPATRWRPRRPRFPAGAIVTTLATAVAVGIAVVALVFLHHSHNSGPTSPVAVGTVSIAAQAPDLHGGLPWGLRTIQTHRLQACLQIGRLQSGQIGALGQDGAFANDHRFHPIPLRTNFPCAQTDAHGNLFLNVFEREVPASASLGNTMGCQVNQPPQRLRLHGPQRRLPTCSARDLRNVAYGVLGPEAVSITYSINHHTATERTGPDGAYLVVVPATTQSCTSTPGRGRGCVAGSGEITTPTLQSGIITSVTYRDGHVCHLSAPTSNAVTAASCPNVGYAKYSPFNPTHITAAQVATSVTPSFVVGTRFCYRPEKGVFNPIDIPCDRQVPAGYKIGMSGQRTLLVHLSFVAPLAADNHHSVYEWSLGRATGPTCSGSGGGVSATTMVPIRAGEHVVLQDNEQPCPGTYEGLVTYQPNGYPGHDSLYWRSPIHDHSTIVGRFTFVLR